MAEPSSLESNTSRFSRRSFAAMLVLIAAVVVPSSSAFCQSSTQLLNPSIVPSLEIAPAYTSVRPYADPRPGVVWSVGLATRRQTNRPIILGTAVGAVAGALIGHAVWGGAVFCPNSPNNSCGSTKYPAVKGAVSGALIGALAGVFIKNRQ